MLFYGYSDPGKRPADAKLADALAAYQARRVSEPTTVVMHVDDAAGLVSLPAGLELRIGPVARGTILVGREAGA